LLRSCSSPAFGSRNGARHGFGNYWFRCSHRSDSRWDAQVESGASTGCWHGGAPRPRGGDERVCVRVSVIIPTHNEAQAIGRVLTDLPSALVTEVIVVDSDSNDGTPEIAAKMGALVVVEARRGYGRACLTGLAAANSPDVVVFLDGDYSDRPSELPILLAPITEGRADITLGSRLRGRRSGGAMPWHQVFGNRLAAGLIRLLYGLEISDLGPFRAGRADVLRQLALEETTYGWAVEMILKAGLAGFRVVEVPVSYYPRIGKSKISGTLKGTVGAAWYIFSLIVRYHFRRRRAGTPRPA
jgi:glycosyltransferase involved in cell wall biosynthesis